MKKIVPFLWFNQNAEEAVALYCAIFPNSRSSLERLVAGEVGPWKPGTVATITFEIEGEELIVAIELKAVPARITLAEGNSNRFHPSPALPGARHDLSHRP